MVSSPTLIGREAQLALLVERLAAASSGQSRIAVIAGEAGVGKSRLVAELRARAVLHGAQIVQGRCFEQDRSFPYAPLVDLVRTWCARRPADELARVFGPIAAEMAKLLPELATLLPNTAPAAARDPLHEKQRLFHALSQFIWRLSSVEPPAAHQPLVLIFEDLHWCDDTSLEWLRAFAHQLADRPLLLLLTYRDDETHAALNQLLAALDRIGDVDEVRLAGLTRVEVEAMLRAIFALDQPARPDFLDALFALTDGNPLFIEEVLKALIVAGDIYREGGVWTRKPLSELHIPRTVQVAVHQRTGRLSEAARQVLTVAAVVGQRFDFGVLQAITQHSEDELLRRVKELIAAQLIVEETDETFAFRHALTRRAIYTALLARERKALHRTVAEALERVYAGVLDARAGELAYHSYEAGLWANALAWDRRAAENAARIYALSEALSHHTRARDCAERLGHADQVAATDHAIGKIERARGQFRQALDAYSAALRSTSDRAGRAALKVDMGEAYVGVADEQALPTLLQALDELDPATQMPERARATLWLGRYYHLRGQYTPALEALERARQLLEPLDDVATLRFVYHYSAAALMFSGRFTESMEWARRCVALSEGGQSLPAGAVGYWYLSHAALCLGRWQNTCDYASAGQAIVQTLARQSGVRYMEEWAGIPPAYAAYYQGDLLAARRLACECVQLAGEMGDRRAGLWANRVLVMLEVALGAEDAAHEQGQAAVREADALIEVTIRCWTRIALADLFREREEWARAGELYAQCAELLADGENRLVQMELGAPMAEAFCAQGRLDEAERLIDETLALTQASGARHYNAVAWRVQGRILAARGQADAALDAFGTAIALCEDLGSRLELAHALYWRGSLHGAGNRADAAHADWSRARALCEQIGARALLWRIHAALGTLALAQRRIVEAERAFTAARTVVETLTAVLRDDAARDHLLRRAGALVPAEPIAASRRATKAEFGGLTERERMVVALIAQGMSNREIAAALVVSERTVTTHISNIFGKLGFSSRTQVATWAGEKGLVAQP
jgi:DNA-binding CsgD family transcriptional regulator/tetratricopeptide (TPR) repeat protein